MRSRRPPRTATGTAAPTGTGWHTRWARLIGGYGALPARPGWRSGIVALGLAALSLLGVLAFHFPQYLTTPELRRLYSVDLLRVLLFTALLLAGTLGLVNLLLGRVRWLNGGALVIVAAAVAAGGHRVEVGDFPGGTPYIGMDWFILDLLGSALIFIAIEKLVPWRRDQPVFRRYWQTDLSHFAVNHFLVGVFLLAVNWLVHTGFGWATWTALHQTVQAMPLVLEVLLLLLVADLVQYLVHRAYHERPWLWRFHAVHHSVEVMDWLAGSRMHVLEVIFTRAAVLGMLFVLGFSKGAMDIYIIIVGLQAVLNHANVKLPWGPLRHVIVTPEFHHWHHASEQAGLDRNYAVHFSFIDRLFGTAVRGQARFPQAYGLHGQTLPDGFVAHQLSPFRPGPGPL